MSCILQLGVMFYLITDMACRQMLMVFLTFSCLLFMCQSSLQLRNTIREEVHAEVGGHVRFPCKHEIQGNIKFMYLQRKNRTTPLFVDGYYQQRVVKPHSTFTNRTAVDPSLEWVELRDVRVEDEGLYESILMDETKTETLTLNLRVTANYSAPVVTVSLSNETVSGRGYVVTCSSSGGYPEAGVEWDFQVAGTQWFEVNKSSVKNDVTMLYTVSRSILINCSQPLKINCSVKGAVSQQIEVCNYTSEPSRPVHYDWMVIPASVVAAILFILVLVIIVKKKKASPSTDTSDVETGIELIAHSTNGAQ